MKKGDILQGYIEKTEFPNKGILHIEDKRMLIKNGIEGQKVEFAVKKTRADRAQGRLLRVLEPSPLETRTAPCPHFGPCGGCSYQCMPYKNQLQLKEKQVKELLDAAIDYEYVWEGITGSPSEWHYRNKMEFSFGDEVKDGPLALGMHKKNSTHDIVNVTNCQIVDDDMNKIVVCMVDYFREMKLPFYHKMRHEGCLRHLVLRRTLNGDMLLNLVSSTQQMITWGDAEDSDSLLGRLLQLPLSGKIVGILHTINDGLADVVKSDDTRLVYGQDSIMESILGLQFRISPFSFFQTNSAGAEVLYEKVRGYVGETKDKIIYDLYSGTGTIAQMLAPVAKKVIGVEIVEEAVVAARENAALNGLTNCEFIAGDVLKVIGDIQEKPDFIVLDPPRDGIHPKALERIIDYGVDQMVYISCKPTSLVRDLEVLKERGYRVVKAGCVDMFAQTQHVETVVLLSQRKADDYVEVELELDERDVTSAESKATYKEIQ
ncbi:MAG: 23S rRNA (uracil(1939)-C(5))-methyltransferase RlmD [Lachnospiraceae bacterium]